jgi:hypothetical protein
MYVVFEKKKTDSWLFFFKKNANSYNLDGHFQRFSKMIFRAYGMSCRVSMGRVGLTQT